MNKKSEKEFKPPFIQVDFQITGKCNARCLFCDCWNNPYYKDDDLPASVWIEGAKKLQEFAPIEYVCIGGGEPFLYKDLYEVVSALSQMKMHTVVVTNGSMLSSDNCKRIIDAGIGHIDFSIDNFPKEHDVMRGIPGLFQKCADAVYTLKKIKPDISLGFSTLICEENIYTLPEFTEWIFSRFPIDAVNFQAYSRVVSYQGKGWWSDDPLWPKNKEAVAQVLDYMALIAGMPGSRINNFPLQFQKFKNYFIYPESSLNIKCPAGTFNFSFSYKGDINGCIAQGPVANICNDDPVQIYRDKFPAVRQKAATCTENCHFLINCYFPLHWRRWLDVVGDMVEEEGIDEETPGKLILPPEVREITSFHLDNYPDKIHYEDYKKYDVIGKYKAGDERKKPAYFALDIPCIYLCGDTSQIHRWGVELDENDFFKQVDLMRTFSLEQKKYHTVVGVRRTNFHRLHKIYNLIRKTRLLDEKPLPMFNVKPLKTIRTRFDSYIKKISKIVRLEGIELRVVDFLLDKLFATIERRARSEGFVESDFLRALGPVCKDALIGPKYVLLDLAGRCNVDCVYCRRFSQWNTHYWDGKHPELKGFMDYEVVKNVLLESKELGVEMILLVGGGEPTLHPHFLDIINMIHELGMRFNISTNGALLGRYNAYLVDGRCGALTASLSFASPESFKKVRPKADLSVMKRIENNIQELSELKVRNKTNSPEIIALYAICKYNFEEIVDMVFHAKKLGANTIWYQLVHLEEFSRDQLYMSKDDYCKAKELLKAAKEYSQKMGLAFHSFIDFEMAHYNEKKGDWSEKGLLHQGCYVGWHFAFVHLMREIFMCCGVRTIDILGRNGKGLKNIWYSDTFSRYRNDGLIMHKENPFTIYGRPLYEKYCDSCDNHDQNTTMIHLVEKYEMSPFVER